MGTLPREPSGWWVGWGGEREEGKGGKGFRRQRKGEIDDKRSDPKIFVSMRGKKSNEEARTRITLEINKENEKRIGGKTVASLTRCALAPSF